MTFFSPVLVALQLIHGNHPFGSVKSKKRRHPVSPSFHRRLNSSRMDYRIRYFVTVTVCIAGLALPVSAQTVRGVVENQTTGRPVAAGFVVLIDSDSVELQRALRREMGASP